MIAGLLCMILSAATFIGQEVPGVSVGPVVRPAARAVFCMGRIRDEEEEGLGDVGSSSNRLKWSTDPNDKSHATCMQTCLYIQYHHHTCLALLLNPSS